jgi:hypothetical protein
VRKFQLVAPLAAAALALAGCGSSHSSSSAHRTADTKTGAGSLFGLATVPGKAGVYFVDDGDNTLKLLH